MMDADVIRLPQRGMAFYRVIRSGEVKEEVILAVVRYQGQVVVRLKGVKGFFGWKYWSAQQDTLRRIFEYGEAVVD